MKIDHSKGLIVDNFAGAGGASTGIEWALGRPIDIAINHDPAAISMYKANHPDTRVLCESVWDIKPVEVTRGRPVLMVWLSPDCKHFSKAKGGKPVDKNIRGLAWVTLRWAAIKSKVIILENVEEFQTWGPLLENGRPCPERKGRTFSIFINALRKQGYTVEWRELRASDYGAPTSRRRLFLVARRDKLPIVWPKPTHGDPADMFVGAGILKPWRTAAEIIDWSLPCPSIFEKKRPLAENTMRRIARGIKKFVIDNPNPFIIKVNHSQDDFRGQEINKPLQTITSKNGWGIVTPFIGRIGQTNYGLDRMQYPVEKPLTTITSKAEHLLVTPTIIQYHGEKTENEVRGQKINKPMMTVDGSPRYGLVGALASKSKESLVTSHLVKLKGTNIGQKIDDPLQTVTAGGLHFGEVRAFLLKYYGTNTGQKCDDPLQTVTSKHRFGLVTIYGQDYRIIDIGMRMLEPHELFAAQGFPDDYIIDHDCDGNRFTKAQQVAKCGNAVPPQFSEALVLANIVNIHKMISISDYKISNMLN